MANINKIKLSGTTYNIQDLNAPKTVELTQAQYDALSTKDPNTFYIITDAQAADLSQYYTSAQTESAITQAVSGKQDTLISGTSIKTINNESILGSGNISIQGGVTIDPSLDSGSTNPVQNKVIYNKIDEVEQVTAAGLNALNDNFGGLKLVKLTQAEYNAIATKDSSTLYILVN